MSIKQICKLAVNKSHTSDGDTGIQTRVTLGQRLIESHRCAVGKEGVPRALHAQQMN